MYTESQKLYEPQPSTSKKYPTSMETHWEEDISFRRRTPHKQGSTYVDFNMQYVLKYVHFNPT